MRKIDSFTKGKTKERNEDFFAYNDKCFVMADGATDKSGRTYKGKTGGEIISRLVTKECLDTKLNGFELVHHLNTIIYKLYRKLGIIDDVKNPMYRFSCAFICARIKGAKLVITYLGDSGFRINGGKIFQELKQVDIKNAAKRAEYIETTGDIKGSREVIMPLLLKQFEYQNNAEAELGYGVIDGTKTPQKFINIIEFDLSKVKSLELFTDGYFDIPTIVSIDAWEKMFEKVEKEDPDKYKQYKSTKSHDDRTVAIITF